MTSPAAKRRRVASSKSTAEDTDVTPQTLHMWSATHQFSLVDPKGVEYETKQTRLGQIIERLPEDCGSAVIFAEKPDINTVRCIVERYRQASCTTGLGRKLSFEGDSDASTRASSGSDSNSDSESGIDGTTSRAEVIVAADESCFSFGRFCVHVKPPTDDAIKELCRNSQKNCKTCQHVINYSVPPSGRKYLDRFATFAKSPKHPFIVFTMVTWNELSSRRCREVVGLLRRAKQEALKHKQLVELGKITEFESALQQLNPDDEEEDEECEDEVGDDTCDCIYCKSSSIGGVTLHARGPKTKSPRVEAVYVHLSALENMQTTAPRIAPKLKNHVCTLVFLHCLNVHDPWAGWEHMFALPEGKGAVRVVFVLAKDSSWHEYPDNGSFSAGVPWMNVLEMNSMDKTDKLLERLVDHEIDLLGGQSDRVVLMGISQGGAQSMLRFLRSQKKLGGWLGAVCHVPTTPHTPRDRDPLVDQWRSSVNRDRPMRLLAGGSDVVFPPALILRDAERLREVGGFSDVQVEVQPTLSHEGWTPLGPTSSMATTPQQQCVDSSVKTAINFEVPDLVFVRKHFLSILGLAPRA